MRLINAVSTKIDRGIFSTAIALSVTLSAPSLAGECNGQWTVPRDIKLILSDVKSGGQPYSDAVFANGKTIGLSLQQNGRKVEGTLAAGLGFAKVSGGWQRSGIARFSDTRPFTLLILKTTQWSTPLGPADAGTFAQISGLVRTQGPDTLSGDFTGKIGGKNLTAKFVTAERMICAAGATGGKTGAVTTVGVRLDTNVYDRPNGNQTGVILRRSTAGVTIVERRAPWYHVKWGGGQGWVYSSNAPNDHHSLDLPPG